VKRSKQPADLGPVSTFADASHVGPACAFRVGNDDLIDRLGVAPRDLPC